MLIDSHCHLDFENFDEDREQMLARARAAGVGRFVTICTHVSKFASVRAVAEAHEDIYCSVGIHPHHVEEEPEISAEALTKLASNDPKVVGIGETGLDYYYDTAPRAAQRESFVRHLTAARAAELPIIVHSRAADEDTAALLAEAAGQAGTLSGVMHCFSSGPDLARTALSLGLYISLSGIVTFKNAEDVREIVRFVPADRLLVETDAPYLAPVPERGKRNEPSFLPHTARMVATLKGMTEDAFAQQSSENFFRLFSKAGAGAGA